MRSLKVVSKWSWFSHKRHIGNCYCKYMGLVQLCVKEYKWDNSSMNQRCLPQCRAEVAWTPRVHPPIAFRWAKKRRQSSCNSNFEAFLNWNFTPKLVDGWGFNSEKMCYSWSVGMMKFPTEWKHIIHVTNHQPEIMDESEIWNGKTKLKWQHGKHADTV